MNVKTLKCAFHLNGKAYKNSVASPGKYSTSSFKRQICSSSLKLIAVSF
jgi:hypothetical protein